MHCWVSGALFPGCNPHEFEQSGWMTSWLFGLCGVLCENCIVDASIKPCACYCHFLCGGNVCGLCDFFVLLCFVCSHQHCLIAMFVVVVVLVVCSLFRAHGGCLGMLSR